MAFFFRDRARSVIAFPASAGWILRREREGKREREEYAADNVAVN